MTPAKQRKRTYYIGLVALAAAAMVILTLGPSAVPAANEALPLTVGEGSPNAKVEAVAEEEPIATKDLWSIIRQGGVLMLPIAACSLILVALVFERVTSLRRGRIIPGPFVRRFLQQVREGELDRPRALELCEENDSPVAAVFAHAVRKWGRPGVEVEQAVLDGGERATNGLRKYLRVFGGVATVAPLLGMLGTVVGMIRAFNSIATAEAMGRPELLAKGISEALLTTAAGLCVAIPALIFHMYFVGRVDRLIVDIDALGQQLVHLIAAEEIDAGAKRPPSSKETQAKKNKAVA